MRSVLALSALLACTCAQARDDEFCALWKGCDSGRYFEVVETEDRCKVQLCADEPPPTPTIECDRGRDGAFKCQAWPQGGGLSYSWSAINGSVALPGWNPFAVQEVRCGASSEPVEIFVTVQSPFGLTSARSLTLSCNPGRSPR